MRRLRSDGENKIDLTPLLDVLFSVLFIVMLCINQDAVDAKKQADDNGAQLEIEKKKNEDLNNENKYLKEVVDSYEVFAQRAKFIVLRNYKDATGFKLVISLGLDEKEQIDLIPLSNETKDQTKSRIVNNIKSKINSFSTTTERVPVMIEFHRDSTKIFTEVDRSISEALNEIEGNNSDVYVRVIEQED